VRSEEQFYDICKDFGPVENVYLLRDAPGNPPSGKAYIRFQTHEAAALYIEAEGGTAATWSESERAAQRSRSVYGSDVYAAFLSQDGRVLPEIAARCEVPGLSAQSEVRGPWGKASQLQARQLHFFAECTPECFDRVRGALGEALAAFHEGADRYARAHEQLRRGGPQEKAAGKGKGGGQELLGKGKGKAKSNGQAQRPGVSLTWDPATGQYLEEDLPAEVQALVGKASAPAVAVSKAAVARQVEDDAPPWARGRAARGARAGSLGAPPQAQGWGRDQAVVVDCEAEPRVPGAEQAPAQQDGLPKCNTREEAMQRGEAFVQEGRALARRGDVPQASEKYRRGLMHLMQFMPDAQGGAAQSPADQQLLHKINEYMSELETMNGRGVSGGAAGAAADTGASVGAGATASPLDEASAPRRRRVFT